MKTSTECCTVLGSKPLTLQDFVDVVSARTQVKISPEARARIAHSNAVVLKHVESPNSYYGINTGVGKNKDRRIPPDQIESYQKSIIYSHAVGTPPWCTPEETRAVLLARLNTALLGYAGTSPRVLQRMCDFLNYNILPLIPKQGSVGVGDIGCLSYIGLGVMGEGECHYQGQTIPIQRALNAHHLKPVALGAKDALSILSSNALSAGLAAYSIEEVRRLLIMADAVYALSLEAMCADMGVFHHKLSAIRNFEGVTTSLRRVRLFLRNSYLWTLGNRERVNESLSFRSSFHIHGTAWRELSHSIDDVRLQLNSSDDNPAVFWETGEIHPTANSTPFPWVVPIQSLNLCLAHVAGACCARMMQLGDEKMTGLGRFLSPVDANLIGFSTVQKTFTSLYFNVQKHAMPLPTNYTPLAGGLEDMTTAAPLIVYNMSEVTRTLWTLLAIETLHSAQAIDLRGNPKLGDGTQKLYQTLRQHIPMLKEDRPLTSQIETAEKVLRHLSQINLMEPKSGKRSTLQAFDEIQTNQNTHSDSLSYEI